MHDGAIIFKSKIDNSELQKDLNDTKREIKKSQKEISKAEIEKLPLEKQAESLTEQLKNASKELYKYKDKYGRLFNIARYSESEENKKRAKELMADYGQKILDKEKAIENLEKDWKNVNSKIEEYNDKIASANRNLEFQKEKAADLTKKLSSGSAKFATATEKAQKSAEKLKKRLVSIAGQAFVFTLISKALRSVVDYTGKALNSNKEFTAELAKLKGALLTAFQPIYELILPAMMSLIRIATSVVTAVAKVAAFLGGKSASKYAESAKALYEEANAIGKTGEEAKKAQKSLAGFDEINQLSTNTAEDTVTDQNTSAPDFSVFDTNAIKDEVDELTLFLSGALLLIGMVLALSGANIPLGIGLMAAGAIGLESEIAADWESVKKIITEKADIIATISSILLVIGIILAFSGAAIPLGIGLIVTGAAGLATAATLNWNSVSNMIKENAGLIAGISAVLLVIGIILCFTGMLPLGIGLIIAGAAGLATVAVVNWDAIKDPLISTLASLLAIVSGAAMVIGFLLCLSGAGLGLGLALIAAGIAGSIAAWNISDNPITRFVKDMANGIIGLVNMIIDAINSLFHIKFNGLQIGGVQIIPKIDTRLLNIPKIPMLAQGAVIPPNREFMAILGDQKHGTNIEAPLSTIQEAVAEVMKDYEAANLAGHEATVDMLRQILVAVLGIEIGDTIIGQAANRYNEELAIVRGRV